MSPEDQLDELLAAPWPAGNDRVRGGATRQPARADAAGEAGAPDPAYGDPLLSAALEAARRLAKLRTLEPDSQFAHALRAQVLARAAARRRVAEGADPPVPAAARPPEKTAARRLPAFVRPALAAASVLLVLGVGSLSVAAASARPGSALFGLHRVEQAVQVAAALDGAARAELRLGYLRTWLAALPGAARRGDPAYAEALAALAEDDHAAAGEIAALPAGARRAALEAELATLRGDERAALRAALPALGWPDRLLTTPALGALGVAVPTVAQAIVAVDGGRWRVTLTGSGFEHGAVLLVDGQPAGDVVAASPTELDATLPRDPRIDPPRALGLGNPDGTAAAAAQVAVVPAHIPASGTPPGNSGAPGTPGAGGKPTPGGSTTVTPGSGDHHGHATPTASPTDNKGGDSSTATPSPTS